MSAQLIWTHEIGNYIFETYNDRPDLNYFEVKQTHSSIVLNEDQINKESIGDGIISKNLSPICIKTADCLPIALVGKGAIAIIHAGWRGLKDNILDNNELRSISPHTVIIGPHISTNRYEVGTEFCEYFKEETIKIDESYYLDLGKIAQKQIKQYFGSIEIIFSGLCTYENDNLNSYRLNKTNKRNYNILRKK